MSYTRKHRLKDVCGSTNILSVYNLYSHLPSKRKTVTENTLINRSEYKTRTPIIGLRPVMFLTTGIHLYPFVKMAHIRLLILTEQCPIPIRVEIVDDDLSIGFVNTVKSEGDPRILFFGTNET